MKFSTSFVQSNFFFVPYKYTNSHLWTPPIDVRCQSKPLFWCLSLMSPGSQLWLASVFTAAWFPLEALLSLNKSSLAGVKVPCLASQHGSWKGSNQSNWYFLPETLIQHMKKNRNSPHFKWRKQVTLSCEISSRVLATLGFCSPTSSHWYFQSWFPPFSPFLFIILRIKETQT